MKLAFAICGFVALAMYVYAQMSLTQPFGPNIIHLRWATDPNPARTAQIALFDQQNPNIRVTIDPVGTGDPSKVIVECATGTGPDIIDVNGSDVLQSLVSAGVLMDLTPVASKMGFDPSHTFASFKNDLLVDGRQYRFPDNLSADAVIFNKKIFDDHGVPYPKSGWTLDDFRRTAKLILSRPSRSGQAHIAVANWLGSELYIDLMFEHGGRIFSPDGLHCELDSPQSVAAMQEYRDMMYNDHIIQTPAESSAMSSQGGWGSGGLDWFSSGRAAMIVIGRWYIVQALNYPALVGSLGAVTMPTVDGLPSSTVAASRAAAVNINSPNRQASLRFLQYLASPGYSKLIVDDGDGIPPDPQMARSGKDLVDEMEPDPAFHQPFLDAVKSARPLDFSPYIDATEVTRWITDTVAKVENRLETPQQALHDLSDQIDQQIQTNLQRRPDLQKLYAEREPAERKLSLP
jgi:multiple sugar transport system substrate-binding protein